MPMADQQAFVLHSRPYRDNQHLVDLLTVNQGKLSALVYIGQSKRSIKKALIQPFLPLNLTVKDLGAIKKITSIETASKSYQLQKSYLYSAFYLNELLIRLLSQDIPCESLYHQYHQTIQLLAEQQNIAPLLRRFELSLLAELGMSFDFEPIFEYDAYCFSYMPEQGFVVCENQYLKLSNQAQLTNTFLTQHLKEVAQHIENSKVALSDAAAQTYKQLMRQVINQLLGNKPLNSRKLFSSVR